MHPALLSVPFNLYYLAHARVSRVRIVACLKSFRVPLGLGYTQICFLSFFKNEIAVLGFEECDLEPCDSGSRSLLLLSQISIASVVWDGHECRPCWQLPVPVIRQRDITPLEYKLLQSALFYSVTTNGGIFIVSHQQDTFYI